MFRLFRTIQTAITRTHSAVIQSLRDADRAEADFLRTATRDQVAAYLMARDAPITW